MTSQKKYYGIKFPFTTESDFKSFVDLNVTPISYLKSNMIHILYTPRGQKLRDPEFGCSLYQKLFKVNNEATLTEIQQEMNGIVQKYFSNVNINNLRVEKDEEGDRTAVVRFDFEVRDGDFVILDNVELNF